MSTRVNVTYDDFDPLISYADLSQWTTPNPQDHPTWYREPSDVTGLPWHEATLHYTTVKGAELSLNFTASEVWLYGALNATSVNYTVTLDDHTTTLTPASQSEGRAVLYSNSSLTNAPHHLTVTNQGDGLGLDLVILGFDLGQGLSNSTIDDQSAAMTYGGSWTTESGDFFNGTSIYTQGPGNSMQFSFAGSGLWIYGDSVADHGDFSIFINGSSTPYGTWNGRTPCGGSATYEKKCEKLGSLKAFVGPLPPGQHNITLVNDGPTGQNATYFDFDYVEYTVPTTYPEFTLNATCPQGVCPASSTDGGSSSNTTSGSGSGSGSGNTTGSSGSGGSSDALAPAGPGGLLLLSLAGLWFIRKLGFGDL
ncbi:hypothetical protein IAU60_000553 [Kwoniella sp. DSM 27419]